MLDHSPSYDVYYVPWSLGDRAEMARQAAAWLRRQPGTPLVLFPDKTSSQADPVLNKLIKGAVVATERNIAGSGWQQGPVLAAWPTKRGLEILTDRIASRVTALCIMEWDEPDWQCNWLTARKARSVVDGQIHGGGSVELDPVVEVAIRRLSASVNHSNGLVGVCDKRDAVETLRALHRAGYRYSIEDLCIFALANGFSYGEVERLREYAKGVQADRRFRLDAGQALRDDIVDVWKRESEKNGQPED